MVAVQILFQLVYFFASLAGLMFLVRILLGPFSPKIHAQMRRHPILHVIWGLFSVVSFYFFFVLLPAGPPAWWDRREQRKTVSERVQTAGGWSAVRQGCELLTMNKPEPFYWQPPVTGAWVYPNPQTEPKKYYVTNIDYGPLPPAVAALKPREIRFYPGKQDVAVMHIRLFGMHSTGGYSTPYFGLEVVCGTGAERYRPKQGKSGGVSGNSHSTYKKVAEGVYEIY